MLKLSVDDLERPFGHGTARREDLCEHFLEWLDMARATGCLKRRWVFGSFVSQ